MKRTGKPTHRQSILVITLMATTMVLGGCNTLGGALWGAYIGAESGTVEGMIGGTIVGAGIGLVADVGSLIDGPHDPFEYDGEVTEYYYPCTCDACLAERARGP